MDIPSKTPVPIPQNEQRFPDYLQKFLTVFDYSKIRKRPLYHALGTQTVGVTQSAIPHGLNNIPNVVLIQMLDAGSVYQSQAADKTNIYLTSDHYLSRMCNVEVCYIPDNLR